MMKSLLSKLIFAALVVVFAEPASAQNAIAKIKYEQAEEAFTEADYPTTISKLDEAEKLLGSSNPKILYLRLMANKGIIAAGKYDYNFLEAARRDANNYLKKYSEVEGIEGKFREVYDFSETLEKLPATRLLFDQKVAEAARRRAEWVKARPIAVSDSLISAYRVKKTATVQEFMAYNPGAFAGLQRMKDGVPKGFIMYMNTSFLTGPSSVVFNANGLHLYSYVVQGKSDPALAKKVYQSLVDLYPVELDLEWVERTEIKKDTAGNEMGLTIIKAPATGSRGSIGLSYINPLYGGAFVTISFYAQ